MALRLVRFLNRSSTQIQAQFSDDLSTAIGIANVVIESNIANIPALTIKSVRVSGSILIVDTSPQFPLVLYSVTFKSTSAQPFISINNDILQENGENNKYIFVGLEDENQLRTQMLDNMPDVYDVESPTPVRSYIANIAEQLSRARSDIFETGNANYLSIQVDNEIKRRGYSATDRLSNEGAFQVLRVATTPEGSQITKTILFDPSMAQGLLAEDYYKANPAISAFPSDPISLRSIYVKDEQVSNAETVSNYFDDVTITLSKSNIAQIHAIKLIDSNLNEYIYDIPRYKYSLYTNRYDSTYATQLLTLSSRQFKLSEAAILDGYFPEPQPTDTIVVSYSYIHNGINVDTDTISVTQLKSVVREPIGALQNQFFLKHAPIVTTADVIATRAGVAFLDPAPTSGIPYTTTHPAFRKEIVYNQARLPSAPGEFSVNYETGQVFTYGASTNNGTGGVPPVASYTYRKYFVDGIDYAFEPDNDELAAVSSRTLVGELNTKITFDYELVLSEGTDYLALVHKEVIDEPVDNRLLSPNKLVTNKYPITNAFRVYNETTGERYLINRFNDYLIQISGSQLPRIQTVSSEFADFTRVVGEDLAITETISSTLTSKIVKFELQHSKLVSATGKYIGSPVNSSVSFTDTSIFQYEFFYDGVIQSLATNLLKLSTDGYFLIDYDSGVVYLRTDIDNELFGDINYTYARHYTQRPRITGVNGASYKLTNVSETIFDISSPTHTSEYIDVPSLLPAGERFLSNNTDKPSILGLKQHGVEGQRTVNSTTFIALDAAFDNEHADGYHYIRFPDDLDRKITSVLSTNTVIVDIPFTDSDKSVQWSLFDIDFSDGYTASTNFDIRTINGIYSVIEVQSLPADQWTNYYDPTVDTFSGNTITMTNSLVGSLTAGDALLIDYDIGNLFFDYNYVYDSLVVSYEYGDNELDFSISDTLKLNDEYYVTYRYGALRQALLANFGSLTQIPELTNFDLSFDRELYRSAVIGALQAFLTGPTNSAITKMVSSITKVDPVIRELDFNEWTADRDNLYLAPPLSGGTVEYRPAGRNIGAHIADGDLLEYHAEAYISHREGTFIATIAPDWRGIDNDASLTFNITENGEPISDGYDGYDGYTWFYDYGLNDGYTLSLGDIFIGETAFNPTEMPFTISRTDLYPNSPIGRPYNIGTDKGYFIWYDDIENRWKVRWQAWSSDNVDFTTEINTTGQFYNITDGYDSNLFINEVSDSFYSTENYIKFSTVIDGYDGYDGYLLTDGIDFSSDNIHYVFDTGPSEIHNRISLFKDGSGYLVGRVFDKNGRMRPARPRAYAISANIQDWLAGQDHQVALSWRYNSADSIDEMHLFVDGKEVANNWKFGGKPMPVLGTDLYRTNATEEILSSATQNTIGGSDGITSASSNVFTSSSAAFLTNGINIGDQLVILDPTSDGAASPHTITGISSETQIALSAPLTLSLTNVNWTVNQLELTTNTDIDLEPFAVYTQSGTDDPVELRGLNATEPQYSISRVAGTNVVTINSGVSIGDRVYINTLGLTRGRIRDKIYKYTTDNRLKTNFIPPQSLSNIDIYKYIFDRISIEDGSDGYLTDGYFTQVGTTITGVFTSLPQPSNTTNGKKLRLTLHGTDNIDFGATNEAIISGTAYGIGSFSETVTFTGYGNFITTNYFMSISDIEFTFNNFDGYESFGAIEIIEDVSLTKSENNGDYAQILSYYNGNFRLLIFGSGGVPFNLEPTFYLIEYPTPLTIELDTKGQLLLGTDLNGNNALNGTFDEIHILNEMLMDIRAGEEPPAEEKSITRYYLEPTPAISTPQTMLLLHFDDNQLNSADTYKTYNRDYLTNSRSVNALFGDCVVLTGEKPVAFTNDDGIVRQDSGTIEFWVSPTIDIYDDMESVRYYVDITSMTSIQLTSLTKNTLKLANRARSINSIRLVTDTDSSGTDYAQGSKLGIDGKTITLSTALPTQNTLVAVSYTPIDSEGDRISIYKDGYGYLNFEMRSSISTSLISYPIGWTRNSWHRVMATYNVNNQDNKDRMRLWVDGVEGGVITWGSPGLIYGTGVVYGSSGVLGSNFLTTNIDIVDTLATITIGNNYSGTGNAMARMDNIRFSLADRQPSVVAGQSLDLNYQSNLEVASPVTDDAITTAIYDFDKNITETQFLSNLLSRSTHLSSFDVDVSDSFDVIMNNAIAAALIESLIGRIKPAHARAYVNFIK
jgi:hypothetical protein